MLEKNLPSGGEKASRGLSDSAAFAGSVEFLATVAEVSALAGAEGEAVGWDEQRHQEGYLPFC